MLGRAALAAYYRLCGVTKHMGSLGGGHYTAVCRDFLTDDWFNFNDAMVSPTSASSAQVSNLGYKNADRGDDLFINVCIFSWL